MSFDRYGLTADDFRNRIFERNGKMGEDACEIMSAALNAVDPYQCVSESVKLEGDTLFINRQPIRLFDNERVFLIGFGKASVPMAKGLIDLLDDCIISATVITKDRAFLDENGYKQKLAVLLGGHPVPDDRSIHATQAVLNSLPQLTGEDLVFIVISGGGSALFTSPVPGVTLAQLQDLTRVLLKSGADIKEINILRKHLDLVKGGRLAQRLQPAALHSLILSDVIGDHLDMIASGPTVSDPTTFQDAVDVIDRFQLRSKVPVSIIDILEGGVSGEFAETLKDGELTSGQVGNHLIGTNFKALHAAVQKAVSLGYHTRIVSTQLSGLTRDVAELMEGVIDELIESDQPACLLFGGETTVKIAGGGLGGRNQDLVLRMVPKLAGRKGVLFISLATDGEDGPTDAAGAASDASIFREGAEMMGLDIHTAIDTNNSYQYLNDTGALIRTGSTGTNVNDLVIILFNNQA